MLFLAVTSREIPLLRGAGEFTNRGSIVTPRLFGLPRFTRASLSGPSKKGASLAEGKTNFDPMRSLVNPAAIATRQNKPSTKS
jgi:hypothetical protein